MKNIKFLFFIIRFYWFLFRNHALRKFLRNYNSVSQIKTILERIRSGLYLRHLIDVSFVWENTPEGHKFWRNIAAKARKTF